jgi:RNA polymerase sigma-70 factor, ECF subfamily
MSQWDLALIDEAEALLRQAGRVGSNLDSTGSSLGRFQLEAAVQSAHGVARVTGRSDWAAIEQLYDALWQITESPVVAINRAIAVAELRGPAAGLAQLDELAGDARLGDYQPYWAARATLLARHGDLQSADQAYVRAIGLERDPAVRRFLQQRRAQVVAGND